MTLVNRTSTITALSYSAPNREHPTISRSSSCPVTKVHSRCGCVKAIRHRFDTSSSLHLLLFTRVCEATKTCEENSIRVKIGQGQQPAQPLYIHNTSTNCSCDEEVANGFRPKTKTFNSFPTARHVRDNRWQYDGARGQRHKQLHTDMARRSCSDVTLLRHYALFFS